MCIAILNASGNTLPEAYLENSWDNNNQGAGLLWVENRKLKSFKTFKYEELRERYFQLRENMFIGNIVLHFRIATAGKHNETNLHPFFVNKNLAFVHNGIIPKLGDNTYSDTWWFNETILKKLPTNFINNSVICGFIKESISWSKLLFLDKNDKYYIINAQQGHWDESGNWFSNESYLSRNDFVYYGNTKKAKTYPKWNDLHEESDRWWESYTQRIKEDVPASLNSCPHCKIKAELMYDESVQQYLCMDCGIYMDELEVYD